MYQGHTNQEVVLNDILDKSYLLLVSKIEKSIEETSEGDK